MCGICGIFNTFSKQKINQNNLAAMADTFQHRGPDDEGYFVDEYYGLGFRRLSILDLFTGNQPISNENNTIQVICNGEIFNYLELKHDLIGKGHIFKTKSDIEVLVHLYEEYGMELLKKINGQFAFAIIDRRNHTLYLARDPFGIMPIFYTVLEGRIYFASEIKAILTNREIQKKVDLTGLDQFFSLPHTVSPRTMFQNIKSIPPGYYIEAKEDLQDIKEVNYWDIDYPVMDEKIPVYEESYYMDKLEELLMKSIQYRLQADVEVGAFLSGGLDSSLITCMMKTLGTEKRKLFSVAFDNEEFTEQKYQKLIADKLGYDHFVEHFQLDDISNRLEQVVYHSEAPVKETYNSATLALSARAKSENIKVILTGEGSDELFAGYPSYRFDKLRYKRGLNQKASDEEKALREKIWGDPLFKYEADFVEQRNSKQSLFSSRINDSYDSIDFTNHRLLSIDKIKGRHPIHQRSYIDLKVRLADHLISDHSDRMLMANSVEGRFPFLDVELVDFIRKIPVDLKLNHLQEKYILKQAARKYVPDAIINREKFIFIAPGSNFLLQKNYDWITDLLSYDRIKRQGYFNPDAVEQLKIKYMKPDFHLNTSIDTDHMLMVIMFCLFLKTFQMPDL